MKNSYTLYIITLFCMPFVYSAGEIIAISSPANNATIDGANISISGTTSVATATVRIKINTTIIAIVTASAGNWNFTYHNLNNGSYTVTAEIIDSSNNILASDVQVLTIVNDPSLTIFFPKDESITRTLLPELISGSSNVPVANVRITIDGDIVDTVATDSLGNWQMNYPALINGQHTLLVELLNPGVVATKTISFESSNPIIFSANASTLKIVLGVIPSSGSGAGTGFTYSVTGTTATITFDNAFISVPVVIATGQDSGGTASVTLVSATTTSATIEFSVGTDTIHFMAGLIG